MNIKECYSSYVLFLLEIPGRAGFLKQAVSLSRLVSARTKLVISWCILVISRFRLVICRLTLVISWYKLVDHLDGQQSQSKLINDRLDQLMSSLD